MKSGRRRLKLAGFRACTIALAAAALWVVCSSPVSGALPPTTVLIRFSDAPGLPAEDTIDRSLRATLPPGSEKSLSPGSVARFNDRLRQLGGHLEIDSHKWGPVVTAVVPVNQDPEARP